MSCLQSTQQDWTGYWFLHLTDLLLGSDKYLKDTMRNNNVFYTSSETLFCFWTGTWNKQDCSSNDMTASISIRLMLLAVLICNTNEVKFSIHHKVNMQLLCKLLHIFQNYFMSSTQSIVFPLLVDTGQVEWVLNKLYEHWVIEPLILKVSSHFSAFNTQLKPHFLLAHLQPETNKHFINCPPTNTYPKTNKPLPKTWVF